MSNNDDSWTQAMNGTQKQLQEAGQAFSNGPSQDAQSMSMAERSALSRTDDGFFCRLWRVVRDERDELILANKALADRVAALSAELVALRARVAERDASVAWAVRRGRRT